MIKNILKRKVAIVIAVTFFLFGFFVTAEALSLSLREIVIGLVAGAVAGVTTLMVLLRESKAPLTAVNP